MCWRCLWWWRVVGHAIGRTHGSNPISNHSASPVDDTSANAPPGDVRSSHAAKVQATGHYCWHCLGVRLTGATSTAACHGAGEERGNGVCDDAMYLKSAERVSGPVHVVPLIRYVSTRTMSPPGQVAVAATAATASTTAIMPILRERVCICYRNATSRNTEIQHAIRLHI